MTNMRRRIGWGVAALALGAAGYWLAAGRPALQVPTASPAASAVSQAAAPSASHAASALAWPALAEAKPAGPDDTEVCGLGVLRGVRPDAPQIQQFAETLSAQVVESARRALLGHADDVSRAVGLYLGGDWEGLARLASATRDAGAYALAWGACHRAEPEQAAPSCGQITAQRWTVLDPDNAMAWLAALGTARAADDESGVVDALHRASLARRSDGYTGLISRLMVSALPADAGALERASAAITGIGIDAAAYVPQYATLARECNAAAMADANRRQACGAVAGALVEYDGSALGVKVGTAVGERVGWPAERVEALRDEVDSLVGVMAAHMTSERAPWGCAMAERYADWPALVAEHGELGAARKVAERSGARLAALRAEVRAARVAKAAAAPETASEPAAAGAR